MNEDIFRSHYVSVELVYQRNWANMSRIPCSDQANHLVATGQRWIFLTNRVHPLQKYQGRIAKQTKNGPKKMLVGNSDTQRLIVNCLFNRKVRRR